MCQKKQSNRNGDLKVAAQFWRHNFRYTYMKLYCLQSYCIRPNFRGTYFSQFSQISISEQNFGIPYAVYSKLTLLYFKMALSCYLKWHSDDSCLILGVLSSITISSTSIASTNVKVRHVISKEPALRGSYDPQKMFHWNVWKWQSVKIVHLENLETQKVTLQ